jgi:hypothetical protein
MSLVISLTCALLATLLQQWARRYLKVTQTRYSLPKRARIRSFFSEGVQKSLLPLAVEALPTMIHVSVFLFFAGLVVFLLNVNLTIFKVVLSWISVCAALYGCITLIPLFRRDSPYYTPLTLFAWLVLLVMLGVALIFCAGFYVLGLLFSCCCVRPLRIFEYLTNYVDEVLETTLMTPEKVALTSAPELNTRAFMWTFDRLDEDHELERFFSGLPGFYNSKVLKDPLHSLDDQQNLQLLTTMIGLLDRTFSSDFLPDQIKRQRADICSNAIELVDTPKAFPEIVRRLASEHGYGPVQSTEILHFFKNRKGEYSTLDQALFSVVVVRVRQHVDCWFSLASDEMGIPEPVLRSHAAHGDNLSLTILIYITRQQFVHIQNPSWPLEAIPNVLEAASKFNAQDTSPKLQHEFCAFWNQAVRRAQNDNDWDITNRILRQIRNVYVSLHQDTDSAPTRFSATTGNLDAILYELSAYPVCKVAEHTLDESPFTTLPGTIQHGNASVYPVPRPSPVAPSFPLPSPFHVDESLRSVPPLDGSHPTYQSVECFRDPITSPDRAMAGEIQDIVALGITASYPTPETFISASRFSISSPAAVSLQHVTNALMPPDSLNLPSLVSNPVLNNILPTGSSLSSY